LPFVLADILSPFENRLFSFPPLLTFSEFLAFMVGGSRMATVYLDDNDDEGWRGWSGKPVLSIEDAVRSISNDGGWLFFYPISIHPDYRPAVWELVQKTARNLPDEQKQLWDDRGWERWQHQCGQGLVGDE
jgi:hypothetical protein